MSSPSFGRAYSLALSGPYLWVSDASGDPFLHVVDRGTGKVLRSVGRRGEGPGEFGTISALLPSDRSQTGVTVVDGELSRLTYVDIDSSGSLRLEAVAQIPHENGILATAFQGGYLGWLPTPGERWTLLDQEGTLRARVDGPLVGPEDADFRQRMHASINHVICVKPDQSRFAVLYGSAGRIELHDSTAAFLGLAAVPDSVNGEFVTDPGGHLRWDRQHFFYVGCAATNRYLFALFSGRVEGPAEEVTYAGDRLLVFDWTGALRIELHLLHHVIEIAIDSAATTLYGSGAEGNVIYRFDIPAEFQGAGE